MDRQIFRATSKRQNAPTGKPFDKAVGKGKAQVRASLFDLADGRALHDGLQTTANRFDFWQFGHRKLILNKSHALALPLYVQFCPQCQDVQQLVQGSVFV